MKNKYFGLRMFSEIAIMAWLFKTKTSLVNVSLNFHKLISQICQYFLLKKYEELCIAKASLIFSTKNFSVFGYNVVRHLTS